MIGRAIASRPRSGTQLAAVAQTRLEAVTPTTAAPLAPRRDDALTPGEPLRFVANAEVARPSSSGVDDLVLDDCLAGDESAWRKLHQWCYPRAAAFLRKLGIAEVDLEDAAQDVFVELFRYLPSFRREAELSTWLYRICISQARSVRRRKRMSETLTRLLTLGAVPHLVSTPSLPEEIVRRRVELALAQMTERDRIVFVLYEMEGVPGKRIAEIVASPEASVWRRLHGARQVFRRALEG